MRGIDISLGLFLSGIVGEIWLIAWGAWVSSLPRSERTRWRRMLIASAIVTALLFLGAIWVGVSVGGVA